MEPHAKPGVTQDVSRGAPHIALRKFRLVVVEGPDAGAVHVSEGEKTIIGTAPGASVLLTDPTVSRFHCEISLLEGRATIRDLGSRNGTVVDGVTIHAAVLHHGAVLALGGSTIRFEQRSDDLRVDVSTRSSFGGLVGVSAGMRRVFLLLERAAESESTVLLNGETGTGKEVAAESIHAASRRSAGPFLVVDCGSLPENLVESELFGHERGAFTGATEGRAGAFEAASGGTLFLDEIGELPLELQPKLLRALEKREIKRLGSNRYVPTDVRVIAATNRDLRGEVNDKRFRSDLFFRLAVLEIVIPPLRQRPEDLPVLVDHLAARLPESERGAWRTIVDQVDLARHSWPGNVRELRNYLERCAAFAERPPFATASAASPTELKPDIDRPLKVERQRFLEAFERAYLEGVLAKENGNVTKAARAAGVDRMHFYRLLWRAGLK